MTVSSEPRTRRVRVPRLVGMHIDKARIVLQRAGIHDFRLRYRETYEDEHTVVAQEPAGDQLVEANRTLVLDISRRSLVHYLPQVFQQSAANEDSFLRGYLYIVQHLSDSVARSVDQSPALFDPRTTKAEFLPWLASWLAVTLSPDWDELQRRKMLLAATRLFPKRGTKQAIEEFVRIYTGAQVSIEENSWPYGGFRIGVSSTVGLDTVILPPMNLAHCFVVRLGRPASDVPDDEIIKMHQIVALQKPAHTSYFLAFEDEVSSGEMGVFMEVGSGAIGTGGVGVGGPVIAAGNERPETETLDDKPIDAQVAKDEALKSVTSKPKSSKRKGKRAAARQPEAASKGEQTMQRRPKTTTGTTSKSKRLKLSADPRVSERPPAPSSDKSARKRGSKSKAESAATTEASRLRRAKANAERQARKEAAAARAKARKARAARRDAAEDEAESDAVKRKPPQNKED